MEINLEQIELVKDRTGVSYKEAKEALEFAKGNVVDAIIYIEENINQEYEENDTSAVSSVVDAIKDAIGKGNVTKIKIFKGEDLLLNVPVTVGAVATLVFPWGMLAAAIAAAASKCRVVISLQDGTEYDVTEKAANAFETIKSKGEVVFDELKDRGEDYYRMAKDRGEDFYEQAMDKGSEWYEQAKAMGEDFYEDAIAKGGEIYENTKVKVTDYLSKKKEGRIFDISDLDFDEEGFEEDDIDSSFSNRFK